MTPALSKLAQYLARKPWIARIGPSLVRVDTALQRLTGGRLAVNRLAGLTTTILTTTGRRTGKPRATPLLAVPEAGGLLVIGSNWGKPEHPAWSANLIANPEATVLLRGETVPVTAELLTGAARADAWTTATAVWPVYDDYTARAGRELRVFRLTRR